VLVGELDRAGQQPGCHALSAVTGRTRKHHTVQTGRSSIHGILRLRANELSSARGATPHQPTTRSPW